MAYTLKAQTSYSRITPPDRGRVAGTGGRGESDGPGTLDPDSVVRGFREAANPGILTLARTI